MDIDGACHCGKVSYTAKVRRASVNICHCMDCQALSGSPWRASIPTLAADFHLTGAEPRIYIKTAESGVRRRQTFCPDCGTPIYSGAEHDGDIYNLRIGAIRQRDQLLPSRQIWTSSALPWACNITGLPASPRN